MFSLLFRLYCLNFSIVFTPKGAAYPEMLTTE